MLAILIAAGERFFYYDNQLTKLGRAQYIKPARLRAVYTTLHSVSCRHAIIKQMTSEEHGHLCEIQSNESH